MWTPCTALQTIASDQTRFYSTNSSCSSVNSYTDVASAFQQVGYTLSQPRLVLLIRRAGDGCQGGSRHLRSFAGNMDLPSAR